MADAEPTPDAQDEPTPAEEPKPSGRTFTQDELNAEIDKRLKRERDKSEAAAKKAADEAAAKALTEQGEYKTLYEQAKAEAESLSPKAQERDAAMEVVERLVTSRKAKAPAHITALLDKLSLTEQLAYIEEHEQSWSETAREGIDPQPRTNNGSTPSAGQSFVESRYRRPKAAAR